MVSAPRRAWRPVLGVLLLLGVTTAVFWLGVADQMESVILRVSGPVVARTAEVTWGLGGVVKSFLRLTTLSRSVRVLEEEQARLVSELSRLTGVQEENARLRKELALLPRQQFRLVSADVIGRNTDGVAEALTINRGTRDGIEAGLPVIVHDGLVVGRIHAAAAFSATVILLTDPRFLASAESPATQAEGLVRGARGLDIVMDTVPRTAVLNAGDRIVTTGTDGVFPPQLLVGTVQSVDAPGNEIFQTARLLPPVDLRRLRQVSVILP